MKYPQREANGDWHSASNIALATAPTSRPISTSRCPPFLLRFFSISAKILSTILSPLLTLLISIFASFAVCCCSRIGGKVASPPFLQSTSGFKGRLMKLTTQRCWYRLSSKTRTTCTHELAQKMGNLSMGYFSLNLILFVVAGGNSGVLYEKRGVLCAASSSGLVC